MLVDRPIVPAYVRLRYRKPVCGRTNKKHAGNQLWTDQEVGSLAYRPVGVDAAACAQAVEDLYLDCLGMFVHLV